ncbi:carboxymuconolactone decarboxylase [Metarhizium guizhouense ARSEF 977]|uniref:Carboxymuconolactone decarboxylase n=1 Tax=Metarhizium guizhouense (strain ARSEF 977) TaxID=1276136 RepID=A0A0B4HNF9_METGA|nr:carboxymuconolactone decarboxylase [Metarhizium guizhouense ARSEF 977]
MARIPLLDIAATTEAEARAYERFPSNLVRGLLRTTPGITNGYLELGNGLAQSTLPSKLREMTILRVGHLSHSAYERMQHIGIAKSVGVTDQEVAAIERGDYSGLTHQEAALLNFVDEVVAKPKATCTFDAALAALGEQDLATATLLVGHYMMTARFLETLAIDLDETATSWNKI